MWTMQAGCVTCAQGCDVSPFLLEGEVGSSGAHLQGSRTQVCRHAHADYPALPGSKVRALMQPT